MKYLSLVPRKVVDKTVKWWINICQRKTWMKISGHLHSINKKLPRIVCPTIFAWAAPELLGSSKPPTSAFRVAGTICTCQGAQLLFDAPLNSTASVSNCILLVYINNWFLYTHLISSGYSKFISSNSCVDFLGISRYTVISSRNKDSFTTSSQSCESFIFLAAL